MELICTNGKRDSRMKFTSPVFCVQLPKAWMTGFAFVNGKQPVKPLLSRPPIKRTPSIKKTLSPEIDILYFPLGFITNPYSADTSIERMQTLK